MKFSDYRKQLHMEIDKYFGPIVLFLTIIDEVKIYDGTSGCQTFIDTGDRAFCQLGFGHNISNLGLGLEIL